MAVVLTASDPRRTSASIVFDFVLVFHAALRALYPLRWTSRVRGVLEIFVDLTLCASAVLSTGYWSSPFLFTLVPPIVAAGFGSGFVLALAAAALMSGAVSAFAFDPTGDFLQRATAGSAELFLGALIAGYGRRLFGEAELRTNAALSRLNDLTEANDLLQGLNALAQRLPASLDLHETVAETMGQLRTILHPDAIAIFLWDSSLRQWSVAGVEGVRLPTFLTEQALPVPVRTVGKTALADRNAHLVDLSVDGPGMLPAGRAGIYAPLIARRTLVGVLAIETNDAGALGTRDLNLMTGLSEQAALAIDNAKWFGRLRTVGAEEERSRIARDLHDRVAQTLAYLAFELDRIVDVSRSRGVTTELEGLRHDVRRVVSEVRDTLYDLRTDVTESQSIPEILETFLDRVSARSELTVTFEFGESRRLALPLEREIWRISQEAITNVEHHARASTLHVSWLVDDSLAELQIVDDGIGFPAGTAGRMDSYGLLGMRERADAIGATLELDSESGRGTTVRCRLEV